MKNIYDGIVVIDANGEAEVELPAWAPTMIRFRWRSHVIVGMGLAVALSTSLGTNIAYSTV
jgi:hypothetical protein